MKMKARKLLSVIMASVLLASLFPFSAAALPDSEAETDGSVLPREQVMTEGDIIPGFISEGMAISDNPSIAWVDGDGTLRALKEGTTKIHCGEETCAVTVDDYNDGSDVVG